MDHSGAWTSSGPGIPQGTRSADRCAQSRAGDARAGVGEARRYAVSRMLPTGSGPPSARRRSCRVDRCARDFIRRWAGAGARAPATAPARAFHRLSCQREPPTENYWKSAVSPRTGSAGGRADGFADVWLRGHFSLEYESARQEPGTTRSAADDVCAAAGEPAAAGGERPPAHRDPPASPGNAERKCTSSLDDDGRSEVPTAPARR